jgi:hypothetical protein
VKEVKEVKKVKEGRGRGKKCQNEGGRDFSAQI